VHERLKRAGGISERIRSSIEAMSDDEKTRNLQAAIGGFADTIGAFYVPWHEDRFAFEILRSAVITLLDYQRPKGEPVVRSDRPLDILGEGDDPAAIGRGLALSELRK
jgi:hypothetical protein